MPPHSMRSRPLPGRLLHLFLIVAVVVSTVTVLSVAAAPAARAATPCDPPVANPVACENTKPGTPDWQVVSKDDSILGFTTDISAKPGDRMDFKMLTSASSYTVDVFRLGWYAGVGARKIGPSVTRSTAQTQPTCLRDQPTALIDCGNWATSVSWTVPADAVSGIYYARLHRNDNGLENEIVFVVRNDASRSKILFQTSDSTWAAYNRFGDPRSGTPANPAGNSLYFGDGPGQGGQAYKVSYNRPYTGGDGDENFIFNAEYPMLRFLEANGYDLSYTTDVDSARRGALIRNHNVFMAVGHDEYWSNEQRANVEAARDAGVHLAFLTGNEVFWKTRWEKSIDTSATDWRTVVCYKETKESQVDPSAQWTGTWRDPRYSPPKDGGRPENALLGNIFTVNGRRDDSMKVPAAYGKMRLWRNTAVSTLATGATYTFQPGTLGYEWNTVEDNGYQPPGTAQLSRTTVDLVGPYALQNFGDLYASQTKTHALTLYRAPSGALVFGAGTVQWAWGVDDEHAFLTNTPTSDPAIKQATVNLLADMGVQPATLQAGLVAATSSTDTTAPVVAITSAPNAATVGQNYTFSGTVSDAAGKVAGVEASVDGGTTWHPATWTAGTTTWSYAYVPSASGTAGLRVRAVDDSVNLSSPVSAAPTVGARTCPCSILSAAGVPATTNNDDSGALELGVKWRSTTAGYVRGVRFYKGDGDTATHTGTLWSATGQQLATGTFLGETAAGWQTLTFASPVQVAANTTYVVSYFSPAGKFAADGAYFASYTRKPNALEPLTALKTGVDGPNGVFATGNHEFPTRTAGDTNYWVDVVWAPDPGPDTRTPILTSTTPAAGSGSAGLATPIAATFDEAITLASVQFTVTGPGGAAVTGAKALSADAKTATFTPTQALAPGSSYAVSLRAADAAGNALSPPASWSFVTGSPRPATCPCTVWDDFTRPAIETALDSAPLEVGSKVRFDGRGEVIGVRFYKGAGNTGSHTGSLWDATGRRLATGTFTGETTAGWQTLTFATPVQVAPNTTYVVSYYAPNGGYAVSNGFFSEQGAAYGPIRQLRDAVDGGNGLYRYGAGGGFPTSTYNANNYWVDVLFRNGLNGDTTPPAVTARTPAPGATGVAATAAVSATFSEPVDLTSLQLTVADPRGARLAGTPILSTDGRTVTWTPAAPLAGTTAYSVSLLVADANGVAMPAPSTWSFTTGAGAACPCSLFSAATVPTVTAADDTGAYELGVRIVPGSNGTISGVRFYKGAGNTGTHTGSLWSGAGQRLAVGTFVNETATGWQTLVFANPVAVQAGASYVASYTTTTGHYAIDQGYFAASGVDTPLLDSPQSGDATPNGVFAVGSGFPQLSYQGNGYWVDALFAPSTDQTPPTITARTPADGSVGAGTASPVGVTFNEPVDGASAQLTLTDSGGTRITGAVTLSADLRTLSFTPAAPLAAGARYTATVRVADTGGNLMPAAATWSFTTVTAQVCPCSLFSAATLPTTPAVDDGGSYELGVRFTSAVAGSVTGVRFYKGAGNTGPHTGTLWSAAGQALATGTFVNESATGWQTLAFATPVPVQAGQTYVASYTMTNGHFAVDFGYFERTAVTSSPLAAAATGPDSPNGVYEVGPGFPTRTYGGNNYWVDLVFAAP